MANTDDLANTIKSRRKPSEDGSRVTYDLTSGVAFSNPKQVAEALAKVFFEEDAIKWFSVNGDQVEFNPTYKVRVVLAEDHNKKLEETVDDFLEDLQKDEIYPKFSSQINEESEKSTRVKQAMGFAAISALLFRHSDKKIYRDYFRDDIFIDLLDKLEIRSLNDKDLMDWKNLPL